MTRLLALCALAVALAGCNTLAGFGKDMEQAGEKIQQKAKK